MDSRGKGVTFAQSLRMCIVSPVVKSFYGLRCGHKFRVDRGTWGKKIGLSIVYL